MAINVLSRSLGLALALTLVATLTAPSSGALTCTTQKLSNDKLYDNCTDLPTLGAFLHYTYNSTNSSLSVAFVASPSKTDGWVAWAINPTGRGMAGAQAFIAFKVNGAVTVKTYDIVSYSNLTQTKLSFDTWAVSAASKSSGEYTIYASAKVPAGSRDNLHYIWQVGPSVTSGVPDKHAFASDNLKANGTLLLATSTPAGSTPAADAPSTGSTPATSNTTNTTAPPPSAGSRLEYSALVGVALVLLGAFVAF